MMNPTQGRSKVSDARPARRGLGIVKLGAVMALCAALVWQAAAPQPVCADAASDSAPAYVRIGVPPKTTVYVEFRDTQMRLATTTAGLKTAPAVKATRASQNLWSFPEVSLPLSARALPAGWKKVRADLHLHLTNGKPESTCARLGVSRADARGALWTCWSSLAARVSTAPAKARLLQAREPAEIALRVTTKVQRREIGVVARVMAGKAELDDIDKDGKSVAAQVTVRDAEGRVVTSKRGTLGDFGFG
jgi:hypothetical protein